MSSSTPTLFEDSAERYVEVAIPVPLRRLFTYRLPPQLGRSVAPGTRVAVPFHGRKLPAIVVGERDEPPEGVKRIHRVAGLLEPEPVFPPELLRFLREAADYYMHPLGEVLRAAAPALPRDAMKALRRDGFLSDDEALPGPAVGRRRVLVARLIPEASRDDPKLGNKQRTAIEVLEARGEATLDELRPHVPNPRPVLRSLERRGIAELEERDAPKDPFFGSPVARDRPPDLTGPQRYGVDAIVAALPAAPGAERPDDETRAFLLHGVTGSGKTEVYLHVIAEAHARGLGALLLVPEIALTPQLVGRLRARFGDELAVLHSGLGDRERDEAWRRLRTGELRTAIGARSALFAPVPDLGVVVVDEEHDPSFKQEEGFRYNARDMALLRAHRAGATAVLGSATPSVETYHLIERGKLRLLELPGRATAQQLPEVEVVDLRRHKGSPSGNPLLSAPLHRALQQTLDAGDQAILFLNRRGFAPSVRCDACGTVVECPACSVALTEHKRAGVLRCHYCDFAKRPGERCEQCGTGALERMGLGTEKLEDTLAEVFAPARVARLDRDTATGRSLEKVLDRLRRREIDVLVGTQMVTKGHDIPGVTLVGVVNADQSLAFPDFRAAERTFQLLSQVAGRAGRGERPGRVIFQTFQPEHPAVRLAAAHDYHGFYQAEIHDRRELRYAPFSRLIAVRVDAGDEAKARRATELLAEAAHRHPAVAERKVQVLGPAPAPIARLRGRFRFRLMLRSGDRRALRQVAGAVRHRIDEGVAPARATLDVDPVSML